MAGINGLTLGFRTKSNKRIAKFTVLTSVLGTTTQNQIFVDIPSAANQKVIGVTIEHFVETGYPVAEGTDPSTVTGTVPQAYVLSNRGITLQLNGVAKVYCSAAVNQGDLLVIADAFGRVCNLASAGVAAGAVSYPVGTALNTTAAINDVAEVALNFGQRIAA